MFKVPNIIDKIKSMPGIVVVWYDLALPFRASCLERLGSSALALVRNEFIEALIVCVITKFVQRFVSWLRNCSLIQLLYTFT